jgi:hypothetical protein
MGTFSVTDNDYSMEYFNGGASRRHRCFGILCPSRVKFDVSIRSPVWKSRQCSNAA